ncbi:hypothetical protein BJX96DRAFT_172611 [Aspergillus floccosus]
MSANPHAVEEASLELEKLEGNLEYSLLTHVKRKCAEAVANGKEYLVNVAQGHRYVSVVMDLVEFLISRGILNVISCAILTTYSEQKEEWVWEMMRLSEGLNLVVREQMVKVASVDSSQSHQADVVVLDWVVDSGTKSDLGFASDNRWANVALTRARSYLIVAAKGDMISNDRLGRAKPREIPPDILVHWRFLLDHDLIVDCHARLGGLPVIT